MKYYGTISLLFLLSFSISGKNEITLSGILLDKADNKPVIACSIELFHKKGNDTALISGTISKNDGSFLFKALAAEEYILRTAYVGYRPLIKNISLKEDQSSVELGKLYLQATDILLQEATIEGKKPAVTIKKDTIEYNASAYETGKNTVVEDLIKKLPGVEIDKDGKITVNGKKVKRFLVDNKEFFSNDPLIASKNLPAEMIEKLQVFDRQSEQSKRTGFKDGSEETVINLSIRPEMRKGLMGNVILSGWPSFLKSQDPRYAGSAFLNCMRNDNRYTLMLGNNNNHMNASDLRAESSSDTYMNRTIGSNRISKFSNAMFGLNEEISPVFSINGDIRYTDSNRETDEITSRSNDSIRSKSIVADTLISKNASVNLQFSYNPNPANIFTIRPSIQYNQNASSKLQSNIVMNLKQEPNIILNSNKREGNGYEAGGSLDYSHTFQKEGRVFNLSMSGQYNMNDSYGKTESISLKKTESSQEGDSTKLHAESGNYSSNYTASVSWAEPLWKNHYLQILYNFSHCNTQEINSTYNIKKESSDSLQQTASLVGTLSRSMSRDFTEHRASLNFRSFSNKINYAAGLNMSLTNFVNEIYEPDEAEKTESIQFHKEERLKNSMGKNLFQSNGSWDIGYSPSMYVYYNLGKRSSLSFNYDGYTTQPSAEQTRSDTIQSNLNDWIKGNPDLNHGYIHNFNLRYNNYIEATQLMYSVDARYGFSENEIISETNTMGEINRLTTYYNISGNWNSGLHGMFNFPFRNKRFSLGGYARGSYNKQKHEGYTVHYFSNANNTGVNYHSALIDINLSLSVNYNYIHGLPIASGYKQKSFNLGINNRIILHLPYDIVLESDISHIRKIQDIFSYYPSEPMWNASLSKPLFNRQIGTGSIRLQAYNIIQQKKNISVEIDVNGYSTTTTDAIPRYFICSFIYNFNYFFHKNPSSDSHLRQEETNPRNHYNRRGLNEKIHRPIKPYKF